MRAILSILLLAAAPVAASAQVAGLTVADAAWEPSYPIFYMTGEGASGPAIHPTPRPDNRLRPGNRLRYPARGGRNTSLHNIRGADAIWRYASVKLTNNGALAVRKVKFDFVFHDPATGEEVLRLGHSGRSHHLRPGQTRVYDMTVNSTRRTRRGDDARLSVELLEVVYSDGSVWRR